MTRRRRRLTFASILVLLMVLGGGATLHATGWTAPLRAAVFGKKSVADRVAEYGPDARARWSPYFARAGVAYPPARVTLVGLKAEKRLDVYAAGGDGVMRFIRGYPIRAASGSLGPKLKRGDGQVPEGIYGIESLNPNSRFHLALRVSFPNAFDRAMAGADGRGDLGGDIMIHGSSVSAGCLAMGDEAAEDLFVLAAETGIGNVKIILAPADLRVAQPPAAAATSPTWTGTLYAELRAALAELPAAPASPPPIP